MEIIVSIIMNMKKNQRWQRFFLSIFNNMNRRRAGDKLDDGV